MAVCCRSDEEEPRVPGVRALRSRGPVARAAADAEPGDVVVLSPAAASFDQFADFEDRGDAFRRLVEELA